MGRALIGNTESAISESGGTPAWIRASPFRHKINEYKGAAGNMEINIRHGVSLRGCKFKNGTRGQFPPKPQSSACVGIVAASSGVSRKQAAESDSRNKNIYIKFEETQKLKTPGAGTKVSGI